ncbi:MAG: FAD-binding protein [Myxococcales bacterium]|nr:FAD-binding protein [Myxococcales bacterium]
MDIYERLTRELGPRRVVRDEEALETYARDESLLGRYMPDAAVLAASAEEVAVVLRVAAEAGVPVTPRGTGTGKTGGALPVRGGIVLSTERMQAIRRIDGDDLVAVVEPGVILGDLQNAVEAQGLFYAPDPASLSMCSLGGNVAANAGGPRAFKYGVTRDWVLGLEVALMGGERLFFGRRTQKGVTGYDLVAGFVGSEGTLGVATEITVKLIGKPEATGLLLAVMPDAVVAGRAINALLRQGARPRAVELLDRITLAHVRPHAPYKLPEDAGAAVLVELDGEAEAVARQLERQGLLFASFGANDVLVARDDQDRERIWQTRRMASRSLTAAHKFKLSEDIVVPLSRIPEAFERLYAVGARHGVTIAAYGHAGDGNLHVNVLSDEDAQDPAVRTRIDAAIDDVFRETLALGGTLSGEHGIGIAKARFMPWEQSAGVLDLQKRVKQAFDPKGLMNPGKIFP